MKKIIFFALALLTIDARSDDELSSPWRYSLEAYAAGITDGFGRAESVSFAQFNQRKDFEWVQRLYRQGATTKLRTDYHMEAIEIHGRYFLNGKRNDIYLAAFARMARVYGATYLEPHSNRFLNPPHQYESEYKFGLGVGVGRQEYIGEHFVLSSGIYAGRYFTGQRDRFYDLQSVFKRDSEKFGYWEGINVGWTF